MDSTIQGYSGCITSTAAGNLYSAYICYPESSRIYLYIFYVRTIICDVPYMYVLHLQGPSGKHFQNYCSVALCKYVTCREKNIQVFMIVFFNLYRYFIVHSVDLRNLNRVWIWFFLYVCRQFTCGSR